MRKWLLGGLTLVLLALVFVSPALEGRGEEDFVVYWSAARLLVTGRNPYDPEAMEATMHAAQPERAWGRGFAWNLPWLLLLLAPLGALPFYFAVRVWFLVNLVLIALTLYWLWRLFAGNPQKFPLVLVAGFFFGATLANLNMGQIVVLILLPVTLAVYFLKTGRDGWAGVMLFFATIKPHLVYFFGFLMLIWVFRRGRWRVLMGGAVALGVALVLSLLVMPNWVASYRALLGQGAVFTYSTTTIDGVARMLLGIEGLRFVGALLIPLAVPFLQLIKRQGWPMAMSLALLISLPLAPYGFGFDQLLLLPAILLLLKWVFAGRLSRYRSYGVVAGLLGVYGGLFWQLTLPGLPYHALTWVPFALMALYALAWRDSPLAVRRSSTEAS
jgi:hypothetical protein